MQDAGIQRLYVHRDLVAFQREERIASGNPLAVVLEPG
jgi:hypothetical protein